MSKFDKAIADDERQQRMDYVAAWVMAHLVYPNAGPPGAEETVKTAWDYAEAWEAERQRRLGK